MCTLIFTHVIILSESTSSHPNPLDAVDATCTSQKQGGMM